MTVVVVAGGEITAAAPAVPDAALVIAADSGVEHAHAAGLHVDLVVGDLDSVTPVALERAVAAGAEVERHPTAKDATDLELALEAAVRRGATRIVVLGGHGGRLDHLLGNVALLSSPSLARVDVSAHLGPATVTVIRDTAALHGRPGDLVTLLPQHGPVHGVDTDGLQYPLRGETLGPGSSRGLSNVLSTGTAHVRISAGVLIAIQPHEENL